MAKTRSQERQQETRVQDVNSMDESAQDQEELDSQLEEPVRETNQGQDQDQHDERDALINQLRQELHELRAQGSRPPLRPPLRPRSPGSRPESPSGSISNFKLSDGAKLFWKQVKEYDGAGGPQKLYAFIDSFEKFTNAVDDLQSNAELELATSKFNGDASMWWREQRQATVNRIQTWEALKRGLTEAFAPVEQARLIREKLRSIKQKGSVVEYNTAFTRLTMQLPNLSFEEAEFNYLQGLKSEIRNLIRTRTDIKDMTTLKNACLRLDVQEFRERDRQEAHYTEQKGSAQGPRKYCNFCKRPGHTDETCYSKKRSTNQTSQTNTRYQSTQPGGTRPGGNNQGNAPKQKSCFYCGKPGHFTKECPKIADLEKKANGAQALFAAATTIIDSGATQHMFNTLDAFEEVQPQNTTISCANKSEIGSTHVGSVKLHFDDNEPSVILQNVLHVPNLKHNLLSVPALIKDGNRVVFEPNGTVTLTDKNERSYEIGHKVGDLYHLSILEANHTTVGDEQNDDYVLWHHRLGQRPSDDFQIRQWSKRPEAKQTESM